jgi:hypothetical protein
VFLRAGNVVDRKVHEMSSFRISTIVQPLMLRENDGIDNNPNSSIKTKEKLD